MSSSTPGTCSASSSCPRAWRASPTTPRPRASPPPPTVPSSTRCSTPGSTCRPARSRGGSCPPPTTTPRWTGWSARCRRRPQRQPPREDELVTNQMGPDEIGPDERGPAEMGSADMGLGEMRLDERATGRTIVHLVRHGEVYNPTGVLYGRLPDYHLSDLGREMAQAVKTDLQGRDITHLRCSPLERAQETIAPLADALGLPVTTDERVLEAGNQLEG